jgi:anti-sigma regulatory factor (Ser/Thr protein kinase)
VIPPQPAESTLSLHEKLPATVGSVAVARRAVRGFAGELDIDVDGLVLAVSEAVANVVLHAYREDARGVVELSGSTSASDVTVAVRDSGGGMVAGPDHMAGAGFGLEIIRRLAQHVELADTPAGVELTMRFPRGSQWGS